MSKKNTTRVTRAAFNPLDPDSTNDPLLKKAMKEPVAFFGGMFAGMLGLSVNDEPLREWVDKTSEAAGMTREEAIAGSAGAGEEDDDDDQKMEKEAELEPATATKETGRRRRPRRTRRRIRNPPRYDVWDPPPVLAAV